jgi:hypothetical protein
MIFLIVAGQQGAKDAKGRSEEENFLGRMEFRLQSAWLCVGSD